MKRSEEEKRNAPIPENDPSKAMDSKKEVEQSPDERTDQDFPGYPHYPAREDMMDQRSGSHRVDADLEDIGTGPNKTGVNQRFLSGQDRRQEADANSGKAEEPDNEQEALNTRNAEIGVPQNVSTEDRQSDLPGTDLEEERRKAEE